MSDHEARAECERLRGELALQESRWVERERELLAQVQGAEQNAEHRMAELASAMLGLVTTYSLKDGPCFCYDFSGHEPETHQDFCITARSALSPEPEAKK